MERGNKENPAVKKNSYAALNIRMKKILDNIIDAAYPDDPGRNSYHRFMYCVINKENQTSSGCYHEKEHRIEVYNPSLGSNMLAKTSLHELAHHIDLMKNGKTGHQKPFYECYRRLIYASIDLGILTKEDFRDRWSADGKKVEKIVSEYTPNPNVRLPERKSNCIIKVSNAFVIKDMLKERGYRWNGMENVWEKETEHLHDETSFLKNRGINGMKAENFPYYSVSSDSDMKINAVIRVEARGKTYEKKEELKKLGFLYYGERKVWVKKTTPEEYDRLIKIAGKERYLEGVSFAVSGKKKS